MSSLDTKPLEAQDFSLGITDYFIDGDFRHAKTMDNLFLTPNKKLRTRWGSVAVNLQLPLGLFRVNKLSQLKGAILAFQDKHCYRDNAGTWTEIVGPASGNFLPSGNSNSVIVDSTWQDHLLFTSDAFISAQKAYIDGSGVYKVRNAGLPELPAGMSVSAPTGVGSTYFYSAVVSYTYNVGTVTYLDRGPVYYHAVAIVGGAISGGNTTTVTLPTTYTPVENWDIANWKVEIYRTTDVGTVYYKLGQVAFGTAAYVDTTTDALLISNESLYTTGGIAENTTPPKAKFVHVVNDYCYWAHIKEGSEILSTTVVQSKAGDPDSVPGNFYADAEQPITGLFSIYDRPIVLCEKYIYRIDNFFSDDGTGGMFLRRIDDLAGCVSQQSIVRTHLGMFWAGVSGFYWSDGFRVVNISDHLNEKYKIIVSNTTKHKRICGAFDPSNQRVFWTISLSDASDESETVIALDLRFPFMPSGENRGGTFTTMSGDESFKATQITSFGNYLLRSDTQGFVLKHGIEYFTDPKIVVATIPSLWGTRYIKHLYESCFLDFGTKFVRKWVPRILISADNTTNLSLAIYSSNDNNRVVGELKPISYKSNISWGDTLPLWGDPSALWNSQGLIEEWRRFPAGGLRCNYKQVSFTNALVRIVDSNQLGQATVDILTNSATLGGTFNWLPDIVDHFIAFSHDNYTRQFPILSRTPTTITYDGSVGAEPLASGAYSWQIFGYPKGEVLLLNGYIIHWAYISKSHTPFSSSSLGSNPT